MEVLLSHEEVRKAIRAYVKSKGHKLAVEKTVNQNTGLAFKWDLYAPSNKLTVKVKLKEEG